MYRPGRILFFFYLLQERENKISKEGGKDRVKNLSFLHLTASDKDTNQAQIWHYFKFLLVSEADQLVVQL